MSRLYKIVFFIPYDPYHLGNLKEEIKERLFELGVGKYDNYDNCSFETLGYGQFRPLGTSLHTGNSNVTTEIREYKIEMVCRKDLVNKAIDELIKIHPYKEPTYEIYEFSTSI